MAIFSPLRSRRFAQRTKQNSKQLIAFRLRQEWFALPIETVVKVVTMGPVYGDPKQTGISLTLYQNQELLVVDVAHRIFKEAPSSPENNPHQKNQNQEEPRYLLIVQSNGQELVGLPIDSPPMIRRVSTNAFVPLPESYLNLGNIQCVSSTIVETKDEKALFLLDPHKLNQPQQIISN